MDEDYVMQRKIRKLHAVSLKSLTVIEIISLYLRKLNSITVISAIQIKTLSFLFLIFISIWGEVYCQNKEPREGIDPYELNLEQLGKIVITASKTPKLLSEVTQKVDVISRNQMSQIIVNNRNIVELIQYLPGASVKVLSRNDVNWGAYGGIGPKYSTYLLNGLTIDGFIDPTSIDANILYRVEVQRGPASVLYPNYLSQDFAGNQSPLAGTVNLILKETADKPFTSFSLNYGSYKTYSSEVYHENRIGRIHFFGGLTYEKSDYTNYGSTDSWLNMLKNPNYQKGEIFIRSTFFFDDQLKHKLTFFGSQNFQWGDVGRINREFDYKYSLLNLGYLGQLTDHVISSFKIGLRSYNRTWQEDNFGTNKDISLKETDGVKQFIIPADISISFKHFDNSNLTIGSDYQYSSYKTWQQPAGNIKITGNDATAAQIGLYTQEELQFNKFTIRVGGRLNSTNHKIDKFENQPGNTLNKNWSSALWSAGIKYRMTNEWTFFANGGSSFMLPGLKAIGGTLSLTDMFKPGNNGQLPNYDLKPETGLGFDLGVDCELFSKTFLSLRTFLSIINEAIIDNVISQNPSQTMSVNAEGKTSVRGFEISLKQQIENDFECFANITITKSEITDPHNADLDGVEVPFVPNVMGNLGVSFSVPLNIGVSLSAHWGGRIHDSNSKSTRNYFDSGEVINLIINRQLIINESYKLDVFTKLYNISNNKYKMPWQFIDPGFNFTFGGRLGF